MTQVTLGLFGQHHVFEVVAGSSPPGLDVSRAPVLRLPYCDRYWPAAASR
jgi:hypothetical protein